MNLEYILNYKHGQQQRLIEEGLDITSIVRDNTSILDLMLEEWPIEQVVMLLHGTGIRVTKSQLESIVYKYNIAIDECEFHDDDVMECVSLFESLIMSNSEPIEC